MHGVSVVGVRRYGDKFVVYLLPDDEDDEAQEDGKEKIVLQVRLQPPPAVIYTTVCHLEHFLRPECT